METVIDALKRRAHHLQRAARRGDHAALQRLRRLPELKPLPDETLRGAVQRRHCLSALARELGLYGWSHLTQLCTQSDASDFGALLYPDSCGGRWNIWCIDYDEARRIRSRNGGYLLCYRSQLLIVDRFFVEDLGVDADDSDWDLIGFDWARPAVPAGRQRLLEAVLRARIVASQSTRAQHA